MKRIPLGRCAVVKISGVDKKTHGTETPVRLCNYTDVYYNWAITDNHYDGFMRASATKAEVEKFKVRKGQVALTKDSETREDIGKPTLIAADFDDVVLGYHCALITPDEKQLNGKYLNALLHTEYVKRFFANNAGGSGQRYYLSDTNIKDLPLFLPDLPEQRKIGKFLSSIDRMIELSRKRIENLEKLAKEIYDYWFVQFDFPDKRGEPYKSSGGKMVYNAQLKREIPSGWGVSPLRRLIANVNTGLNPRDNFKFGGNIRYLTVKNLTTNGLLDLSKCDMICEAAREMVHRRSDISVGDILFASIEPLGRCYLILEEPKDWDINESIFSIRPNYEVVASEYLFYFLMSEWFIIKASRQSVGSIFKGIRINELQRMDVLLPCRDTVLAYSDRLKPVFKMIHSAAKSINELTQLREFLLPLLMNGQAKMN